MTPFEREDALEMTKLGGRVAVVADMEKLREGVDVVRLPVGLRPLGILADHCATSLVPVKFDLR